MIAVRPHLSRLRSMGFGFRHRRDWRSAFRQYYVVRNQRNIFGDHLELRAQGRRKQVSLQWPLNLIPSFTFTEPPGERIPSGLLP